MRALFFSFKIGFIACISLGLGLSSLLAEEEIPVRLELSVGDDSSSHSERYNMIIKDKENGSTLLVHQAPSFGKVETTVYNQFRTGKEYEISLVHTGTDPGYLQNNDNKPDYDYFAKIKEPDDAQTCNQGRKPILIIKDEQKILGDHGESDYFYAQGKTATLIIALLDLDIEHPATGEVAEEKEEQEGLVAVKRDEETPLTRLKLKPIKPSNVGGKYYLTQSGDLKIWKSANRTGAVTEQTEFNPDVETTLYVEALEKSDALNDQEITLNWRDDEGENDSAGDWVNLTAVQAEFPITIRAFIPYLWTEPDVPASIWDLLGLGFYDVVARGDNRQLSLNYEDNRYRLMQQVVITPYKDLHQSADKISKRLTKAAANSTHYRKETSVPEENQSQHHGYALLPNPEVVGNGPPPPPEQKFEIKDYQKQKTTLYIEVGGEDGALPWYAPSALIPDLNWKLDVTVDCGNPIKPKVRIENKRDGFPAYEVIALTSDSNPIDIYYWAPPWERQVGPYWLTTEEDVYAEKIIP